MMKLISNQQQEGPELVSCSTVPTKPQHQQHQQSPVKAVAFSSDLAQVKEVLSFQDYTTEEMQASFYKKLDFKNFKRSLLTTLKLNRAGELPEGGNDEHTMRGIECRTREGAAERKVVKSQARNAVLEEQDRQRLNGIYDAELLALVSFQMTADAQQEASIHGMCDELEVRNYRVLAQAVSIAHMNNKMLAPSRSVRLLNVEGQTGLKLVVGQAA